MDQPGDFTPRERFLRACRRQPVDRVPAWLMRQAGRYMPEYREIREGHSFLEMCKLPELCRDITLQPIKALGVETAIVFSDILLPAEAMGLELTFDEGGPKIGNPVRCRSDVEGLVDFEAPVSTPWPAEAIRLTGEALGEDIPIIGFCGAPFTLASYMVEGAGSRAYENIKKIMFGEPQDLELLLERITENLVGYLEHQIDQGAAAVQVFDSWAGCLSAADYARFAHPWTSRLISRIQSRGVPVISYVNGCDHLLEMMADSGADVLSIDWKVDPARARARVGDRVALQGNLDPAALLATPQVAAEKVRQNLEEFGRDPGYIFNLGSGVLKWTPVECAKAAIETVREW